MCTVRSGISSRFILLLAVLLLLSSTAYSQTIVNSSNLAEICPTGDCCELIDNSDPLGKTDSASHAFILRFKDTKKQIYRFLERTENGISKGVQKKFNSASNQVDAEVFNLWNSTWNGQFSRYAVLCESDDNFECIPKDTAQTRKDIRDGAYALAQETSFAKRIYLRAARKHKRAITARKLRTFKDLRNTPDKILAQMINVTDGETCVVPDPLPDPSPETSPVPDSAKPSPTPIVPVTPPPPPPAPPVPPAPPAPPAPPTSNPPPPSQPPVPPPPSSPPPPSQPPVTPPPTTPPPSEPPPPSQPPVTPPPSQPPVTPPPSQPPVTPPPSEPPPPSQPPVTPPPSEPPPPVTPGPVTPPPTTPPPSEPPPPVTPGPVTPPPTTPPPSEPPPPVTPGPVTPPPTTPPPSEPPPPVTPGPVTPPPTTPSQDAPDDPLPPPPPAPSEVPTTPSQEAPKDPVPTEDPETALPDPTPPDTHVDPGLDPTLGADEGLPKDGETKPGDSGTPQPDISTPEIPEIPLWLKLSEDKLVEWAPIFENLILNGLSNVFTYQRADGLSVQIPIVRIKANDSELNIEPMGSAAIFDAGEINPVYKSSKVIVQDPQANDGKLITNLISPPGMVPVQILVTGLCANSQVGILNTLGELKVYQAGQFGALVDCGPVVLDMKKVISGGAEMMTFIITSGQYPYAVFAVGDINYVPISALSDIETPPAPGTSIEDEIIVIDDPILSPEPIVK